MYMNLTEDMKTVKNRMQVGRFVAVTDKLSGRTCCGTVLRHEGQYVIVKSSKSGNERMFSMTSGVWIFRYRNFEA